MMMAWGGRNSANFLCCSITEMSRLGNDCTLAQRLKLGTSPDPTNPLGHTRLRGIRSDVPLTRCYCGVENLPQFYMKSRLFRCDNCAGLHLYYYDIGIKVPQIHSWVPQYPRCWKQEPCSSCKYSFAPPIQSVSLHFYNWNYSWSNLEQLFLTKFFSS